jgi:hypothetical protein
MKIKVIINERKQLLFDPNSNLKLGLNFICITEPNFEFSNCSVKELKKHTISFPEDLEKHLQRKGRDPSTSVYTDNQRKKKIITVFK